jgi:hypothetical protein
VETLAYMSTGVETGLQSDGNKSLHLVFMGVIFLSILDCF